MADSHFRFCGVPALVATVDSLLVAGAVLPGDARAGIPKVNLALLRRGVFLMWLRKFPLRTDRDRRHSWSMERSLLRN